MNASHPATCFQGLRWLNIFWSHTRLESLVVLSHGFSPCGTRDENTWHLSTYYIWYMHNLPMSWGRNLKPCLKQARNPTQYWDVLSIIVLTIQVSIPLSYCFSAHFVAIPLGFGAKIPMKRIVFRPPRGCWMLQRRLGQQFYKKRMMILFQKMASDGIKHDKTVRYQNPWCLGDEHHRIYSLDQDLSMISFVLIFGKTVYQK